MSRAIRRDEHRGRERPGEPVLHLADEDVAEPTAIAREAGDRSGGDDEDGREPYSGQDQRQPERQLDPGQDPAFGQPHPARRLHHVTVDAVHPQIRVREDRRDSDHDERHRDAPEADAEEGDEETDDDDDRQRAPEGRRPERKPESPVAVAQPEPEREGEDEGDRKRGERELHRLPALLEQQRDVRRNEAERVHEDARDDHRTRVQGVTARCSPASRKSAVRASRTASPPATSSSVWKRSGA